MQQLLAFDGQPSERLSQSYPTHLSSAELTQQQCFEHALLRSLLTNSSVQQTDLSFLRWEKDKGNTAAEQKSSFLGLLPWGSISLCHRKLRYHQVLPGSSSKPLSANTAIPAYVTCTLFSIFTQQTPKHFVFSLKEWEALAVWISKSDWISYKEKGQNCTCLLKPSKSMEWSHFLDFH